MKFTIYSHLLVCPYFDLGGMFLDLVPLRFAGQEPPVPGNTRSYDRRRYFFSRNKERRGMRLSQERWPFLGTVIYTIGFFSLSLNLQERSMFSQVENGGPTKNKRWPLPPFRTVVNGGNKVKNQIGRNPNKTRSKISTNGPNRGDSRLVTGKTNGGKTVAAKLTRLYPPFSTYLSMFLLCSQER